MTLTTIIDGNMMLIMTHHMTTISHMTTLTRLITILHTTNMVSMIMMDSMTTIMTMLMVEVKVVMVMVRMVDTCMLMISMVRKMKKSKERILELKNRVNNQKSYRNKVSSLLQKKSKN
jgi:hypothetical protein